MSDPAVLISLLSEVAAAEPFSKPNVSCRRKPVEKHPDCKTDPGFNGVRLRDPRRIVLMVLFSFEVDTLEILLMEHLDLLEKIFIVESSWSHKGVMHKSLLQLFHDLF